MGKQEREGGVRIKKGKKKLGGFPCGNIRTGNITPVQVWRPQKKKKEKKDFWANVKCMSSLAPEGRPVLRRAHTYTARSRNIMGVNVWNAAYAI